MDSIDVRRILTATRRVVIDWYDGEIQAVVHDPPTGYWYLFAVGLLPGGRRYVIVEVGPEAFDLAASVSRFQSPDDVVAFGDRLLASVEPGAAGFAVDMVDNKVANVTSLAPIELSQERPRSWDELFTDRR